MNEEAQKKIQEKLTMAQQLLKEAGELADSAGIERVDFMGLVFTSNSGWIGQAFIDGPVWESSSDWNSSDCGTDY